MTAIDCGFNRSTQLKTLNLGRLSKKATLDKRICDIDCCESESIGLG
jgi:hypothetical protein